MATISFKPKKVTKKNDRTSAAPSGFPFVQVKKWEVPTTRFASEAQTRGLLYPFFAPHKRQLPSGTAKTPPRKQQTYLKNCQLIFGFTTFNLVSAYVGDPPTNSITQSSLRQNPN